MDATKRLVMAFEIVEAMNRYSSSEGQIYSLMRYRDLPEEGPTPPATYSLTDRDGEVVASDHDPLKCVGFAVSEAWGRK